MKKRLLLHIGTLGAGGAEKSLLSFLNTLPKGMYEIDLLLLNNTGIFKTLIPEHINVISPSFPYNCFGISPSNWKFYIKHNPKYFIKKVYSLFKIKINRNLSLEQTLWSIWQKDIQPLNKEYDIAMSYLEGITNYYILDKVKAKRKIIWIHNEYTKLGYNKEFDEPYFRKADYIVTISELCKNNLVQTFPNFKAKIHVLQNITNPNIVREMSQQDINDPLFDETENIFKILSVGRFSPQKNYPLAIETAKILKDKGLCFKWYIIGEGPLKKEMEIKIASLSLEKNIILLGLRSNPYTYMDRCDIIVQSSLFEGKSIAIDEAKILCKPIVATNYETVYDVITDGKNGLIAEMTPTALAEKVMALYENKELRDNMLSYLKNENINNVSEINNYIKILG